MWHQVLSLACPFSCLPPIFRVCARCNLYLLPLAVLGCFMPTFLRLDVLANQKLQFTHLLPNHCLSNSCWPLRPWEEDVGVPSKTRFQKDKSSFSAMASKNASKNSGADMTTLYTTLIDQEHLHGSVNSAENRDSKSIVRRRRPETRPHPVNIMSLVGIKNLFFRKTVTPLITRQKPSCDYGMFNFCFQPRTTLVKI